MASVQIAGPGEESPLAADLFPVAGEAEQPDGSLRDLPRFNAYVAFLPAELGDVGRGPPAELIARDGHGDTILTAELSWVTLGKGASASTANCAIDNVEAQVCVDARSGERERVDETLGMPPPARLQTLLTREGYSYAPGTDEDRELAAHPEFNFAPKSVFALSAFTGAGYPMYLGRLSGHGLEDRLAYVLPDFPADRLPERQSGAEPPVSSETATFIVDALTGETLARLGPD